MKHLLRAAALLSVLIGLTLTSIAQQRVVTRPRPVTIIADTSGMTHIFSEGWDKNRNGREDYLDFPPSWSSWYATQRLVSTTINLPWGSASVSRVGFALDADVIDFCVDTAVVRYTRSTRRSRGTIARGSYSSVFTSADGNVIWLAHRPKVTGPGSIVQIRLSTGDTTIYNAGVNPQAAQPFIAASSSGIAFINEGTIADANGTLEIITDNERTTIPVGNTPNHLLIRDGRAYVTVSRSHHVVIIDLAERRAIDTISVGTSGAEGPRECVIDTEAMDGKTKLFVTTHKEDVRIFDLATGRQVGTLAVRAKPDGLAIVGRDLWVTGTYLSKTTDEPGNQVVIFKLDTITSVSVFEEVRNPSAYLLMDGILRVPFALDRDATITDITGKMTPVSAVVSDAQTIDCRHLPSGVYALRSGEHSVTIIR